MRKNKSKKLVANVLTANDFDDDFGGMTDRNRIKYISSNYANMSLTQAFGKFYNEKFAQEVFANKAINNVVNIEVGACYCGAVKNISDNGIISFEMPGVKEEIVTKENFSSCRDAVENYLLTHGNKLLFEVRERKPGKFIVSVINAYYKNWVDQVNKIIRDEDGINVHIDSLVNAGYVCHTVIWPLYELTGKEYTSQVFIPGSQIVLNIELDFERWVGQDVTIVPQNFVEFRRDYKTGLVENSLIGSRKKVLQKVGMKYAYELYEDMESKKKLSKLTGDDIEVSSREFEGTVTGVINSNKKNGVFIELDDVCITGLLPINGNEVDLLDYKPGDRLTVKITDWEVQQGKDPFIFNNRKNLVRVNARPILAKV